MNREYILVAFMENQIGVLNRISIAFLRRKINVESIKASESSIKGITMLVISAFTTEDLISKTTDQISKIIEVIKADYYTPDELITQEIALYKISSKFMNGNGRIDLVSRNLSARMIEMNAGYVVMEKTGPREEIEQMRDMLQRQGVLQEFTRSGSVILHREESLDQMLGEDFGAEFEEDDF